MIDAFGNRVQKVDTPEAIDARHQAILNNMQAYLIVLSVSVVVIFIFEAIAQSRGKKWLTEHPVAYWGPWLMAVAITVTGWVLMAEDDHDKLFNGAHDLLATEPPRSFRRLIRWKDRSHGTSLEVPDRTA